MCCRPNFALATLLALDVDPPALLLMEQLDHIQPACLARIGSRRVAVAVLARQVSLGLEEEPHAARVTVRGLPSTESRRSVRAGAQPNMKRRGLPAGQSHALFGVDNRRGAKGFGVQESIPRR